MIEMLQVIEEMNRDMAAHMAKLEAINEIYAAVCKAAPDSVAATNAVEDYRDNYLEEIKRWANRWHAKLSEWHIK
jgi:uncharacterized protein with gpF-like domain